MLTDDSLVSLYQTGDNNAFDQLLARYQDKVFQYILIMLNADQDAANDAFQDTFVRAITAIKEQRYQANGQFQAWIMRIARNIVLDSFRSKKTQRFVRQEHLNTAIDTPHDVLRETTYSESNAEIILMQQQSRADIRTLIDRLPEQQREVITLRYYQDLSFKEIAQLTGTSINTSLGRMRYAIINLRRMVQRREDFYIVG